MCSRIYFLLTFFIFKLSFTAGLEPCLLSMSDIINGPVFRPFFLTLENEFYPSSDNIIKIGNGKHAIVTCQNNYLKNFPDYHNITILCNDASLTIESEKKSYFFKDFTCDLKILEEIKHEVNGCNKKGINYVYYDKNKEAHVRLAEVCYDFDKYTLLFSRFTISKVFPSSDMILTYKKVSDALDISQKSTIFRTYLTDVITNKIKETLGDKFNMGQNYIERVKLIPKLFYNEQLQDMERFASNLVTVWKTVADGNRQNILNDIKSFYEIKKNELEIIFGTHDTLVINNKQIFLNEQSKMPVPYYLWTVVHEKDTKKAIAIVTINNPFISASELKKKIFCENKCKTITWFNNLLKYDNYDKVIYGYTFCCSMDQFNIYPLKASGILNK